MHFRAISGLSDECVTHLNTHENWRLEWNRLLHVEGQYRSDFQVNEFTKKHDLLTFTFVRHPFDRSARFFYILLQGHPFRKIFIFTGQYLHLKMRRLEQMSMVKCIISVHSPILQIISQMWQKKRNVCFPHVVILMNIYSE